MNLATDAVLMEEHMDGFAQILVQRLSGEWTAKRPPDIGPEDLRWCPTPSWFLWRGQQLVVMVSPLEQQDHPIALERPPVPAAAEAMNLAVAVIEAMCERVPGDAPEAMHATVALVALRQALVRIRQPQEARA